MITAKLSIALVRSFSLGFAIHSPMLNGAYFELYLGCVHFRFWNRGEQLFAFENYWRSTP